MPSLHAPWRRRSGRVLASTAGALLALPTCAWAEAGFWGGGELFTVLVVWPLIIVGVLGLLLGAALGAAGLVTALRARLDSASKVFARGFLGVSAVAVFLDNWVAPH